MRILIFILTILVSLSFRQSSRLTTTEIEKYAKSIDELRSRNKLKKVSYPDMSGCGGALDGYYLKSKLVLIDATYQAELGYSSKTMYIDESSFLKIIYREHFAEWGKYEQNYPSDKYEFDAAKMTYSDTIYSITLSNPTVFHKMSNSELVSKQVDKSLVGRLLVCGQEMRSELKEVTDTIRRPNW